MVMANFSSSDSFWVLTPAYFRDHSQMQIEGLKFADYALFHTQEAK